MSRSNQILSVQILSVLLIVALLAAPRPANAQVVEAVGSRALGMGGAFVAVATDSSATWWNPAALAAGPFVDSSVGRASGSLDGRVPARGGHTSWWALTSPVTGLSYYRIEVVDAGFADPTAPPSAGREDGEAGVPVRSLSVRQFGLTLVQTLLPGVHAGTTLKYVRGTLRTGMVDAFTPGSALLDRAEDLRGGSAQNRFDLDAGIIAVAGPMRFGGVIRNIRAPRFTDDAGGPGITLPRQVRVGVAFDAAAVTSTPLTVALDADVRTYRTATGDRRVIALGAEQWLLDRRLGLRAGARINTVGAGERAATAGISVAVRTGMYLEAHVVRGGADDEQGWGAAARVSF